ncbi:hypothetical protein ACYATM_06480 [Lactobacillaceae bacterium Scapto_B20]
MKPIKDDHSQSNSEPLTRSEYRKRYQGSTDFSDEPDLNINTDEFTNDEALSRQKLRQDKIMMDEEMKREIAERKAKRLAHRLDITIGLLILGIVIVLIVLFFVN